MSEPTSRRSCPECGLDYIPKGKGHGCPHCLLRLAMPGSEASSTCPERPPPPGLKSRFFGDYEIVDEIARGGMGVVYRARQLGLNRLVAMKMVQSSHLLSDEARLRFRVEIEAVAQLHHPHIVSLYESGEHDGAHYFTMRLVEGGDLAGWLKKERSVRELVQLLVKVCRAVHYAHQRGILHRDLKPSNILVDAQGEPHVADFGLAKSLDHDTGFTFTSSVLGSPNYMAPEQATGKTRQLTTAVDVYGLGAVLYHLIAGRPPFQARTPIETLRQVADHDPAPPRSINPNADRDLETIALKCLRKESGARYGTAEELAQDLERWLAGDPILARPLGPLATLWRWSRRHPAAAVLGLALTLALVAIGLGTGLAAMRIRRAEAQSAASLRESLLREASSFRLNSELGNRAEGLRLLREASDLGGSAEFRSRARNELLATVARTDLTFVRAGLSNVAPQPALTRFDAKFERIATVQHGTNILIRSVANGVVLQRLLSADAPVSRVESFSPSGRFLALQHTNGLSIWDLETGTRSLVHHGTNNIFAFAPREDTLLLQHVPNEAVSLELPSGQTRLRWSSMAPRPGRRASGWRILAFSPDGRTLAGASGTSPVVELMDPATGNQIRLLTNSAHIVAMTWSRHGTALAVATADSRVFNWNPTTGALRWSSPLMIAPARSITFHPRGDWVAVVCENEQVRILDNYEQGFAFEHPAWSEQVAFAPDGKRLGPLLSGDQWGWLEMRPPEEFAEFRVASSSLRLSDVRFSPDARILAVGHSDRVVLWDTQRGALLRDREEWRMSACVFHPREKLLFVAGADGQIVRHAYRFSKAGNLTFFRREIIHPGSGWRAFAFTPDVRFFAACNVESNAAFVFDHTLTNRLAMLGPHTGAVAVAISPDGRWLTTAGRSDSLVRVWNVATGKEIMSPTVGVQRRGVFSADGRWLAVAGEEGSQFFENGTWKPLTLPLRKGRHILGAAAFSPDSRILAVVVDRFTVELIDLQLLESAGVLRPPGLTHLRGLAFSADGSRLAAVGPEARVAIWHLDRLQERLAEFGLEQD